MQKRNDHSYRFDYGVPLLITIVLGALFFGAYLVIGRIYQTPPAGFSLLFIGAYLFFALLTYAIYLVKQYRKRNERVMHLTLNDKMHNLFKYTVALPYAIVDEQGRVRVMNEALQNLIGAKDPFYRGNVSDLCYGVTLAEIMEAERYKAPTTLSMDAIRADKEETVKPPARGEVPRDAQG